MEGLGGCLRIMVLVIVMDIVLACSIIALVDSFIDKHHCVECGREINGQRFCPDCGTPTDTLNTYDYWHKPKED